MTEFSTLLEAALECAGDDLVKTATNVCSCVEQLQQRQQKVAAEAKAAAQLLSQVLTSNQALLEEEETLTQHLHGLELQSLPYLHQKPARIPSPVCVLGEKARAKHTEYQRADAALALYQKLVCPHRLELFPTAAQLWDRLF